MKIFYFGSVCNQDEFDRTVKLSRKKPAESAQNFEKALIKGFSENNKVDITVVSAESISSYPNGYKLFLKKRQDKIVDGVNASILSAINLPIIKQLLHASNAKRLLNKWLKENESFSDKAILVYGTYTAVNEKIVSLARKYNCKCFAIITDSLTEKLSDAKKEFYKKALGRLHQNKTIEIINKFDGYILLTESMKETISGNKPYTVIETIVDTKIFDFNNERIDKCNPKVIMYAGTLFKKYGIDVIVESFKKLKGDYELWIFGSGDYEDEIIKESKNNKAIKFFGRVNRKDVLIAESKASLLINLRNSYDEYTKYSFPSKMVEYMLSGTPLLTSKLSGIPEEYYDYVYSLESATPDLTAKKIEEIFENKEKMDEIGLKAKQFILENKNEYCQSEKILDFINSVI